MTLLNVHNLSFSYSGPPLLDQLNFRVAKGDRVCVFGRNGEGKSTLLKLIHRDLKPDSGSIDLEKNATVGGLPQEVPEQFAGTVFDVITTELGPVSGAMSSYQRALALVAESPDDANLAKLERAQTAMETSGGWDLQHRIETVMSRLDLDGAATFGSLSGGWRRRVYLARALALKPDVLILDEPTNHLDVAAIEWLEQYLAAFDGAVIFVTHDRRFLRRLATRIVEIDRGQLREYPPDFDAYVHAKTHDLEVEERHNALFDKKLAQEEKWIRTPIQARRTRNEGRVRALKKLRAERKQRRNRKGNASISVQSAERSGDVVIRAAGVSFRYDGAEASCVDRFDFTLKRKDRIGFIGPNGVGKTTLVRVLLGELAPQSGAVERGTNVEVGYFDQLRDALDPSKTLADTVVDAGDFVEIDGNRRHVVGYLRDFLFDESQVRAKVSTLSGGERNRLMLATLFAKPTNLLVLDEPTNDLDMETLEVLETQLLNYDGTVLLVSHDREFLDNIVTDSLLFLGDGEVLRVAGGYDVWDDVIAERKSGESMESPPTKLTPDDAKPVAVDMPKSKLTYAERLELESLPEAIETLETRQSELHKQMAVIATDPEALREAAAELAALDEELETTMSRWEELESRS